ncbi:MAG TPA: tetratricopeptide repeat protein [Burkholderiales bacterium]
MNPIALLAAVAVMAYLPSLIGPFHFDDYNVIVNYPTVHSWSTLSERAGAGVRAVLKASYVLNWTLDPGPLGFHVVNIALHALNTVLLFFIGKRLIPDNVRNYSVSPALLAALLFALHPMQTEAVTYISGRSSSLMATFYLGALLAYLRGAHWTLSCLLFVLAMATRETAVTLPAALLLIELCRGTAWRAIVQRQAAHWLLLAAGAVVVLMNQRYFDLLAYGYGERSLGDNLLTQIGGVSYLVWHLVALHDLNIDPALPTLTEWTPALAFQGLLLSALLALGIASLRRRPWLAFGILWFFLQLAPTNSIVPRLDVANDRQLYLACWGLFFALAVQIEVPRAAAVALCLLFAGASVMRQLDYRDEITLWEASVRSSPWNARAHNNLGYAYYQAGRKPEARREFETALMLDRTEKKARANLVLLDWR